AVATGTDQQAAIEVGGGEDHLRGRLVLQVAPEVSGNAGFAQHRQVGPGADFIPEIVAGQRRDTVAEGHRVPQARHGGVVRVLRHGGAQHATVRILVQGHTHQVIAERLVGTGIELGGNAATAHEVELVEV